MANTIPENVGKSGIKLIGIESIENGQLANVISQIEEYSTALTQNFEATTKQIKQKLDDGGSVAILSLQKLIESKNAFDEMVNKNFQATETLLDELDGVLDSLNELDEIQAQVNQLYDTVVTFEQFVKHPV
ncbi:hypothetical protein M9Y10_033693 [Tritrichomonas musculus]|uniref:Biogenesis of lysosome-related organelles complex 1 subunit 2 n=1 Tax=Tritrichomonas musculus TaxID=1915356 RepID=A0ABR2KCV3_9EUKA